MHAPNPLKKVYHILNCTFVRTRLRTLLDACRTVRSKRIAWSTFLHFNHWSCLPTGRREAFLRGLNGVYGK